MRARIIQTALVAGMLSGIAADANGQAALFLSGGVATDQLGQRASAISLSPSLAWSASPDVRVSLGGSLTRYATAVWSMAGAGDLVARRRLGDVAALVVRATGHASRLSGGATGVFAVAEMQPALELRVGRLTAFAGPRLAAGSASDVQRQSGMPTLVGNGISTGQVTRSGTGAAGGAEVRLDPSPDVSVGLTGSIEALRVDDRTATDRTIALRIAHARVTGSLMVGARSDPDERRGLASASVSIPVGEVVSLDLTGARYAANRLLGTPGGDFASAGLSWRFGRARDWSPPRPVGAPPPPRGFTRLAIRSLDAKSVELAGDFNEWKPVAARRAANGVWYVDLRIPAGRYRYAFRIDRSEWRVPDGAAAVDDGFGGKSAWLVVHEPGTE